jgi:phosphomannomutase/phosphoglucomutase
MQLDKTIFRMYDIRGEVDKNFSPEVVNLIGKAYAIYIKDKLKKDNITVSIGRDIRLHSEKLVNALIDGLTTFGINVINLGICPTPALYFSLFTLPVNGGIMVTGSHNPPEFNGMKVCIGKETIYGEEIQNLYKIAKNLKPVKPGKKGTLKNFNILKSYKNYLLKAFTNSTSKDSNLKIVIDSGNGCAGLIVPNLLKQLGINVIDLYSTPDGHFPNHHPDPTIIETLNTLRETAKKENADFGIAYDGDVDRIGVVDENGNVVYGDKLTYIFAKDIIKKNPGAKIIGEVKCSKTLFDGVKNLGGVPIMSPVGHSLIKKKLKEENALLAGEMSGHIFFNDRYFGYDDAIYATLRLMEIVAKEKTRGERFKFSDLLQDLPQTFTSPEIRINVNEKDKFKIIDSFLSKFKSSYPDLAKKVKNIITIDGLRIEFPDGWGLIRASNTQPVLVMRFEAETEEKLEKYKDAFEETLN